MTEELLTIAAIYVSLISLLLMACKIYPGRKRKNFYRQLFQPLHAESSDRQPEPVDYEAIRRERLEAGWQEIEPGYFIYPHIIAFCNDGTTMELALNQLPPIRKLSEREENYA
ncbi:MAG: hypothetical protein PHW53_04455 [Patescibacteria group bacterium]|nr:hypothetical protein [Patescibacteria group bacterium]